MASRTLDRIEAALEPVAASNGLELVAVELGGAKHKPVVRVFLDKEGGITLDEVAEANGWIADALDELGEPAGAYTLEVSSPGVDRPLRKPSDFQRFAGSRAEVRTLVAHDGRKQYTGTIARAGDEDVTLDVDGTDVTVRYDDISKAHLKVDIDFQEGGTKR